MVFESSHALQHFVEVHLMSVELWAVDTYKFGLASDSDTAGATHTGAIHHNGIQMILPWEFHISLSANKQISS